MPLKKAADVINRPYAYSSMTVGLVWETIERAVKYFDKGSEGLPSVVVSHNSAAMSIAIEADCENVTSYPGSTR